MDEILNININNRKKEEAYFTYYKIDKEASIYEIAKEKNINPELLAVLNGLETSDGVFKNQLLMLPKNEYSYYIAKKGDTLGTVAHTFNSSIESLLEDNPTIYVLDSQLLVSRSK